MSKMLIDRSVVEQALEALTWCEPEGAVVTAARSAAINALRAALEQEEQEQEPVGNSYADLFNALQRIETAAVFLPSFKITHEGGLEAVVQNIVDAIAALEQEEQEPVGWNSVGATSLEFETECSDGTRFLNVAEMPSHAVRWRVVTPPRREWRGLEDYEIDIETAESRDALMDFVYEHGTASEGQQRFIRKMARAIEAALKERNHG